MRCHACSGTKANDAVHVLPEQSQSRRVVKAISFPERSQSPRNVKTIGFPERSQSDRIGWVAGAQVFRRSHFGTQGLCGEANSQAEDLRPNHRLEQVAQIMFTGSQVPRHAKANGFPERSQTLPLLAFPGGSPWE